MLSWRLHLKVKKNERGNVLTTISSIKKPEVGEAIHNTFKGEWAHIQTSSRTTKANQVSTNMV